MALISLQDVSLVFGGPLLLEEINLQIGGGERSGRPGPSSILSGAPVRGCLKHAIQQSGQPPCWLHPQHTADNFP